MCTAAVLAAVPVPCRAPALPQPHRQHRVAARPAAQRRVRVLAAQGNGSGSGQSSPVIGAPQQQHVIRMVNLVNEYFGPVLTDGDMGVAGNILEPTISHKDMVRNIGRIGIKEYEAYLTDLHQKYPDYYVRPTLFGIADSCSIFVSFEGRISAKSPKFEGVDLILFNDDASRIKEVQVFRSSWLGAQGHEERKKLAEAAARVASTQAAAPPRGQLP